LSVRPWDMGSLLSQFSASWATAESEDVVSKWASGGPVQRR
jgi:hypothetical protein